MTAPCGARLPRSTATPPSGPIGRSRGAITSALQTMAPAMFSPSVRPFTVTQSDVEQVAESA